jgi:hypothetical protein
MKTEQHSQKWRLAQKIQTQPGKEYSFSIKPGLREKRQIEQRFANVGTALKSVVSEQKMKRALNSTKKHQYKKKKKDFVDPTLATKRPL